MNRPLPVQQYDDLEDSMTDALINDKPQFVRLFAENGLNILDYLTYGRLETLYRSVAAGTVLFQLLQRCLVERLGTAAFVATPSNAQESPSKAAAENVQSGPMSELSLFEVGFYSNVFDSVLEEEQYLNSLKHLCLFFFLLRLQVSWNC